MENNKFDMFINPNDLKCLICWEEIDIRDWTTCIICNIYLHKKCEIKYRGNKGYCQCPHYQDIGTLGSPHYN